MLSFLKNHFDTNRKEIEALKPMIKRINDFEPRIEKLSDEELTAKTAEFRFRLSKGETLDDIIPEAFAVIRESVKRVIGQRAFDVQLMAALTLHKGRIAEQKTGEGKTLSAALVAYVNALSSKGVHVVTVNDYLTKVGAGWYGRALTMLGLKVAAIIHEQALIYDLDYFDHDQVDDRLAHLKQITRQEAYQVDVTYGTNNEFGFDYLRDNLVGDLKDMVQHGHNFAIVDEVDSILIDEARTPLIISAPDTDPTKRYYDFAKLIDSLNKDLDYSSEEKTKTANLTEHGIAKVEKMLGVDNLYEKDFETIHLVENALKARVHYLKDRDYVLKDGEVIIVDEFTGRLMNGRRWSDGLHQSVEAKEGVVIQQESKTLATISFQNYFRMYEKLAGMTGTAATEAEEFKKIYKLEVISIPTNQPMIRKDHHDVVYKTCRAKYSAIVKDIEACQKTGQPVLVGTTSVTKNEIIDQFLTHKKIPHQVLNAKQHEREASIVAKAGEKGAVTIATNMAGRGVDIELGGARPNKINFAKQADFNQAMTDWQKKHDAVLSFGGLHVIGTERHESRRIDNQLRGRSGRQGDPGSSRFFVALDDDLMRIFGGEQIASLMTRFNIPEDMPLEHGIVSRSIEQAQVKVEGFNFDMRKNVVEYDDVMNKQREIIYKLRKRVLEVGNDGGEVRGGSRSVNKEEVSGNTGLKEEILEKIDNELRNLVLMYSPEGYSEPEYDKIIMGLVEILPFDPNSQGGIREQIEKIKDSTNITEFLSKTIRDIYEQREKAVGKNIARQIERFVYLDTIDKLWIEHLTAVDDLREGVGLRGYGQRDPLVEYKKEAFNMFESLIARIDADIVRKIFRIGVTSAPPQPQNMMRNAIEKKADMVTPQALGGNTQLPDYQSPLAETQKQMPITKKQIGRNDPCWCGSGKKFKKCHYPQEG